MSFERLVDDAALDSAGAPVAEVLRAYRALAACPATGRLRCPVARIGELRRHLVPEDLLDLAVVADAGTDVLPRVLDGVRGEPRVRPASVHVALPPGADQARAAAVAIARLPRDAPVFVGVRYRAGRRAALDRVAAARARGAPLGAEFRAEDASEFVPACLERGLPFTCTAERSSPGLLLRVLRLAAGRAAGGRGEPAAVRRALVGFAVPDVAALLRDLDDRGPVRTRGNGEHLSP
ncbi:hypothetical protein [Actinomadura sp. WMMB 499]|uniref:hypothetical protein n=1 Tax=Actinomadura sp. WMMB 499 TaxID=1219491 RepID=UPI0012452C82|nr:hypothetical protein [Actinomadura sp. WMMB 499]QFG21971.1 hypothetical protein F7P10_13430 [Actinomadura sp. WMMB 499]